MVDLLGGEACGVTGPFDAIQKKTNKAMNPKMIKGKLKANPICTHCAKRTSAVDESGQSGAASRQSTSPLFSRCLQSAALLAEFRPRIVHRAQRAAQFLVQIRSGSSFWIDRFDQFQMLAETFPGRAICSSFFCVS